MERTEAYYIDHCDDGSCDLGCLYYECPKCNKNGTEYGDAWWKRDTLYNEETIIEFNCRNCKTTLFIKRDFEEGEYFVYIKK